jgi:hypothetical protein
MFIASRRAFVAPAPRRLDVFMNRDPRFALSQELEAKKTLLDQIRALLQKQDRICALKN